MGVLVATGAAYLCSGGAGPGTLAATGRPQVLLNGKPAMTVKDGAAYVNIVPCPACVCPTHPAIAPVLSVTGVIVPQPCTPQVSGMWIGGQTKALAGGVPCLTNEARLMCAFGGVISVADPGQTKVLV